MQITTARSVILLFLRYLFVFIYYSKENILKHRFHNQIFCFIKEFFNSHRRIPDKINIYFSLDPQSFKNKKELVDYHKRKIKMHYK